MLANRLYKATANALGSEHHLQIAGAINHAEKIVMSEPSRLFVEKMFTQDPWQFECNLDAIVPPQGPFWIEWPNGSKGGLTGCLFIPWSEDPAKFTVITGWDVEGGARHAFAVGLICFSALYEQAFKARNQYSRTPAESLARMMMNISVTMPEGFADEIEIISDSPQEAAEGAMRDATADIPFALAAMIAIAAEGGPCRIVTTGTSTAVGYRPPKKRSPLGRGWSWLTKGPTTRLSRKMIDGRPVLRWVS